MKTYHLVFLLVAALLESGCKDKGADWDASGVFEATEVVVSARATGELLAFSADEGRQVQAGEALGCVDTLQLALQKRQLAATLRATSSRLLDADRQLASLRQEIANLRRERQRFGELLQADAATGRQVDEIDYQLEVLERRLAATSEQLESNNSSLDGQAESIKAQLAQVEDRIRKSVVVSPITGTVLTKYAETGEYAQPGCPLFKVADLEHMRLRAYVTADQLTELKIGQRATVYADSGTNGHRAYEGTVSWIADKAEFTPKTVQTRDERANLVYAVKVDVANDGLIKRGMYGDVKFLPLEP